MFTPSNPEAFYETVWNIVRQVPAGIVTTYGQIASMIPQPDDADAEEYARLAPRWVGDAMNAVSSVDEPTVPWHRVINSKGGIAMSDTNPASALQRARLRAENIVFSSKELIDLDTYGWDGPSEDWIEENGLLPPRPLKRDTGQMSLF